VREEGATHDEESPGERVRARESVLVHPHADEDAGRDEVAREPALRAKEVVSSMREEEGGEGENARQR